MEPEPFAEARRKLAKLLSLDVAPEAEDGLTSCQAADIGYALGAMDYYAEGEAIALARAARSSSNSLHRFRTLYDLVEMLLPLIQQFSKAEVAVPLPEVASAPEDPIP